jgi:FkbM family methyltransferase
LETAWWRRGSPGTDFEIDYVEFCITHYTDSVAQLFQDLLALFLLGQKRDGFFVEFGATDGISFSNSFLLEKKYGWHGILAEPARSWHSALRQNRRVAIDTRCVWGRSGEMLEFNEPYAAELSTIEGYSARDDYALDRRAGQHYSVATISLQDLLRSHDAPRRIDYLSIDTEGSEFAILSNFDFARYEIAVVTVEHNYVSPDRENIAALMQRNDFV